MFHLAALIGIPFSYHSPDSYIDTNIKGTLNCNDTPSVTADGQTVYVGGTDGLYAVTAAGAGSAAVALAITGPPQLTKLRSNRA